MHRRLLASIVGTIAMLSIAPVAIGGGWATIVPDGSVTPIAGEPIEIGFTVMQHGQTPTSRVTPSIVVSDPTSSAGLVFPARQSGPTGHFVATITVAEAGNRTWTVTLPELIVEMKPIAFVVVGAGTVAEAVPTAPAELDRVRSELTLLRTLVVGLTAALIALLAGGSVVVLSRRRRGSDHDNNPAADVAYGS